MSSSLTESSAQSWLWRFFADFKAVNLQQQEATILCNTLQYHAIPCNIMQYHFKAVKLQQEEATGGRSKNCTTTDYPSPPSQPPNHPHLHKNFKRASLNPRQHSYLYIYTVYIIHASTVIAFISGENPATAEWLWMWGRLFTGINPRCSVNYKAK